MSRLQYLLRLPRAALRRRVPLAALLRHATGRAASPPVLRAFALSPDEQRFADALTERHAQFWLYRSHQRAFCGDFVVVDMSAPRPHDRRVYAVDLKAGARLRRAAGIQMRNRHRAVAALATAGVILPDTPAEPVLGDRRVVLAHIARTLNGAVSAC